MDREEAAAILMNACDGSFCVRESKSRQGEFALALKYDKTVRHLKIDVADVREREKGDGWMGEEKEGIVEGKKKHHLHTYV